MSVVVRSRVADGVELVELDDPGRYNALTVAMVSELRDTCADLRADRDVRAVIITGRGKGFCAGANMTGDDVTPPEALAAARAGRSTSSRTTSRSSCSPSTSHRSR